MANIKQYLDNILHAIFGREVRQSIHNGIEAINNEVGDNTIRQDLLERKYNEQIANIASSEPQNAEIVDARQGFRTLGEAIRQKIYHFNNVEEMKNCLTLLPEDVVQTSGYFKENDGGAGTYQIINDTTLMEDDGSTHILKNKLRAKLVVKNEVNIKQLGAKGDGVTDDTTVIKNALKKYKSLFFPNGTYIISETLVTPDTINLLGESPNVYLDSRPISDLHPDYVVPILDIHDSTNVYMCNFNTHNSKYQIYPPFVFDPTIHNAQTASQLMKNKNFHLENVLAEGNSTTNWNMFLCTPKPDNYERDWHTALYPRYPMEIINHSGYCALNITNTCVNEDDEPQVALDNSAIGIVDKALGSSPAFFIDMHATRNAINIKNRTGIDTANSTDNPDSVFQVDYKGHMALGCSVYDEPEATGVGTIKLKDNNPSVRFYDTNNINLINVIRSQNRQFQFLSNGTLSAYLDDTHHLNTLYPLITANEHQGGIIYQSSNGNGSYYHTFVHHLGFFRINRTNAGTIQQNNAGYIVLTNRNGTTLQRPTSYMTNDWQSFGYQYFDTILGKPIWWNGTEWVDALGTVC